MWKIYVTLKSLRSEGWSPVKNKPLSNIFIKITFIITDGKGLKARQLSVLPTDLLCLWCLSLCTVQVDANGITVRDWVRQPRGHIHVLLSKYESVVMMKLDMCIICSHTDGLSSVSHNGLVWWLASVMKYEHSLKPFYFSEINCNVLDIAITGNKTLPGYISLFLLFFIPSFSLCHPFFLHLSGLLFLYLPLLFALCFLFVRWCITDVGAGRL